MVGYSISVLSRKKLAGRSEVVALRQENYIVKKKKSKQKTVLISSFLVVLFSLVFLGQVIVYLSGDFQHAMFKRCSKRSEEREGTVLPANIYLSFFLSFLYDVYSRFDVLFSSSHNGTSMR